MIPRTAHLILAAALALAACGPDRGTPDPVEPPTLPVPPPPGLPGGPVAPVATPGGGEIPQPFRGQWIADPANCGSADESRLILTADGVRFHESAGPVRVVTTQGPPNLSVAVELTGEGETRTRTYDFRLSADGETLTDVTDGRSFVRRRCPQA